MRCNLHCRGCYSGLYSKDGELSEEEIEKVLREAREFGSYFIVVSGGEPYLMKDVWLRLWKKHSDMYFMTYTNGTLLDQKTVDELARLGNVAPAISVEGYQEETDRRRGAGVFERLSQSMESASQGRGDFRNQRHLHQRERRDGLQRGVPPVLYRCRGAVRLVFHVHARGQGSGS